MSDAKASVCVGQEAIDEKRKIRFQRISGILLISLLCAACAPTTISAPSPAATGTLEGFLCARLDYDGSNAEWVPRSIRIAPADQHRLIRYRYEVGYGLHGVDDETVFDLLNPLLIVGATKSKDSMYVLGLLQMETDGAQVREYRDVVILDKSKSIFSEGDTLTEMRRQGLLRLRDVMDSRLSAESAALHEEGFGCE